MMEFIKITINKIELTKPDRLMLSVFPIKAFQDNYIWCIEDTKSGHCIIVDPGDAQPVIAHLKSRKLALKAILVTHHHYDHTDGIAALIDYAQPLSDQPINVFGSVGSKIKQITQPMKEGDTVALLGTTFFVNEVAGHTLDHISFYSEPDALHHRPWVFCGDTLFSGGCGRLFEGTPSQMLRSLNKLSSLPAETEIYCTHEYTLSNLAFAKAVLPNDETIKQYISQCEKQRNLGLPTLPAIIATELQINPFLNAKRADVQNSVSQQTQSPIVNELDTFTRLRSWKDSF